MSNGMFPENLSSINSENLSSIIFFSENDYGVSGQTQAEHLAGRMYGETLEGLGTLAQTIDGDSYWSNYKNIIYKESEYTFDNVREIYKEALTYSSLYLDEYSGCASIENGRFTARYSYQDDLHNDFSNAQPIVFNDMKSFICSLNFQTFNKQKMYNGYPEVSSIRLGSRSFDWHYANEIAYEAIIREEEKIAYTYTYNYIEELSDGTSIPHDGSYIGYYIIPAETMPTYYGDDNYYTYTKKQHIPIDEFLTSEISLDLSYFEDNHSNNHEIYAYYMSECMVAVPMTLTTYSFGNKRSTFIAYFESKYDGWFYDGIKLNASFNEDNNFMAAAIITSYEDNAVFSIRKNENEKMTANDVVMMNGETKYLIVNKGASSDETTMFTTPYKMKELSMEPIAKYATGTINLSSNNWMSKGNHIETLVLGSDDESNVNRIVGLNTMQNLKYLDIKGMSNLMYTPAISTLSSLNVLDARGSNITAFKPKTNSYIYEAWLPETLRTIKLDHVTLRQDTLNVLGHEMDFFGRINYEPTAALSSFTCSYSGPFDSYEFVSKWINELKSADKLKTSELIYLELNGIDWDAVPMQMMRDLKVFDLDINKDTNRIGLGGKIKVSGTGNYGLLTIDEYSELLRMYGRHAFTLSGNEKVFENLTLSMKGNTIEPYDFFMKVSNTSVDISADAALQGSLPVSIIYKGKLASTTPPIAQISFIDIIKDNPDGLHFVVDRYEKYAACKLQNPIDTTNSVAETPVKGDIMMFNGQTILIFFGTPANNYKYVKIGHIDDIEYKDMFNVTRYVIENWFAQDEVDLKFEFNEKPETLDSIDVENMSDGRTFIMPESDELELRTMKLGVGLELNEYNESIDASYKDEEINVDKKSENGITTLEISASTTQKDIDTSITLKSKKTDPVIESIMNTAENQSIALAFVGECVNTTIDMIIANAANIEETDNGYTIVLSNKLYAVENDTLVVKDPLAATINEDGTIELK